MRSTSTRELPERVFAGLAVLGVGRVGVGDARLPLVDPVPFLAAVAEWQYRRDVPAAEEPDRLLVARLAVGAEALGFGVDAVVGEHVAVGVDDDDGGSWRSALPADTDAVGALGVIDVDPAEPRPLARVCFVARNEQEPAC